MSAAAGSARRLPHDWFPRPLPGNVLVGEGSWVHSAYAFIHCRSERECAVRIGRDTGVYIDTFFDLGPRGAVEVGDSCTLAGPIFSTDGRVRIGDRAIISREVVFADRQATTPPGGPSGAEPTGECDVIVLGNDVWIGTRAVLLPGARLGDGAIVGAAAIVDFEVPARAVVAGNPADLVGWT